jgi:hypothetical protein
MKPLLDNGALVTLGLMGVVVAVGAANKAGLYGSRAVAGDQAPVRREVLHLLLTAEVGAGALDAFAETLASGAPLRAEDIEDAVARAEERLEDARYEVRTGRISEHRAGNRADRDHYLRVLKAIRRLRPS